MYLRRNSKRLKRLFLGGIFRNKGGKRNNMAVLYDDDKKIVNDAWQTVNSPVVKAVQATQNAAKAAYGTDGKIYATGGSGKQFVYNPDTGNIGVNNGGTWNYVKSGDATYGATLSAMNADTGNLGSLYKAKEEAQAAQQPEPVQIGTGANLDGLNGYGDLFNRYAGGAQQIYDNLAKGIDASTAYQEQLAQQKAAALEQQRQAANRNAYVEYQRQVNPYGYNAEVLASMGLDKSGYAESSLVAYGNALMAAIQSNNISYNDAMMNLENIAAEARLNGDTQKAQLAAELATSITNNLLSLGQAQIGADASAAAAEAQRAWEAQQEAAKRAWQAEQNAATRDYEAQQAANERNWKSGEAALDRQNDITLAGMKQTGTNADDYYYVDEGQKYDNETVATTDPKEAYGILAKMEEEGVDKDTLAAALMGYYNAGVFTSDELARYANALGLRITK